MIRTEISLTDHGLLTQLGIPTANIPPGPLDQYPDLLTGVYYGFVGLLLPFAGSTPHPFQPTGENDDHTTNNVSVHPAVLSIGYNPFYGNKVRSIEIHLLQPGLSSSNHQSSPASSSPAPPPPPPSPPSLPADFYDAPLNLLMLGFIRPEYDYVSRDSLIDDINIDCQVARTSLERAPYRTFEGEETDGGRWLRDFSWAATLHAAGSMAASL